MLKIPETYNECFGIVIYNLRNKNKLTQIDISKSLNLQQSFISKIENGNIDLTLEHVKMFANYFKIKPYKLVQLTDKLFNEID